MHKIIFESLDSTTKMAHIHVTRLKGPQITVPHTHDFYEVFLVLEGAGTHHFNRRKYALRSGDLVVLRPQDAHWFSTISEEVLVFVNVAVSTLWWKAFHTVLGVDHWVDGNRATRLTPGDTQRLGAELNGIGFSENPLVLLQVWQRIREYVMKPDRKPESMPPLWLENLRKELGAEAERLLKPISYWQQRSGRSPEHLARSCRKFYGVTFSEVINQAKIELARYLLRTTDEKVITIAFDCGFENMAHFHRVFARLTGRTPGSWRLAGTAAVPIHATTFHSHYLNNKKIS